MPIGNVLWKSKHRQIQETVIGTRLKLKWDILGLVRTINMHRPGCKNKGFSVVWVIVTSVFDVYNSQ